MAIKNGELGQALKRKPLTLMQHGSFLHESMEPRLTPVSHSRFFLQSPGMVKTLLLRSFASDVAMLITIIIISFHGTGIDENLIIGWG